MMKEAAAKAMKALEGMDSSNIQSISILFKGQGKGPMKQMDEGDSEESDSEEADTEEGCKCSDCGKECEPEDKYCSACGGDIKSNPDKDVEGKGEEKTDSATVRKNEYSKQG